MFKKLFQVLSVLIAVLLIIANFSVFAETASDSSVPYESYTYWYNSGSSPKAVYSRPMYEVSLNLDFVDLGLNEKIEGISDICSENGKTYVLDGKGGKVIILNSDYTLNSVIGEAANQQGEKFNYKSAEGIFVNKNGVIFIADTANKRVLTINEQGILLKIYTLPESNLIPSDFEYKPQKVAMDSRGYLYVLSEGSYYGAILYSPENEFLGFYGANTVKNGIAGALKKIFNRIFLNNTKKSGSERSLPYQFVDLYIDNEDFVFTATGNTNLYGSNTTQTGQIKRLSPGGQNILDSDDVNFADTGFSIESQDIVGIEVDDDGFFYAVDSKYGHIFMYDSESTIMTVFGTGNGGGTQTGSFSLLNAITLNGDDVIVTDEILNTITVFKITDYGKKVKSAQKTTVLGKYKDIGDEWNEILSEDSNSQLAYMGLAKYYYANGEYDKAMEYAKTGYDRSTYSLAFEVVRNQFIKKAFPFAIIAIVLLIAAIFVLKKYVIKNRKPIKINEKLKNYLSLLAHPADCFSNMKEKKQGSLIIAVTVTLLYYILSVAQVTLGGFAYTYFDSESFNALFILLQTVGLIMLFTVSFWGISVLNGGLGKLKDIFIVTSYSFTPLVIMRIVNIIALNILTPDELGFLSIFNVFMTIYTVFILTIGLIKINDFEFGKFVKVVIFAIVGMVVVLFLLIVVILLLQLLSGFLSTVFSETVKLLR